MIKCSIVGPSEDQESTQNVGEVQSSKKEIKLRRENRMEEGWPWGKDDSAGMTFLGQLQE